MSKTYEATRTMVSEECCHCGMLFGMTADFQRWRRKDHEWFYCPRGHKQYYDSKSDEEELRDQLALKQKVLDDARRRITQATQRAATAERKRAAQKGQVTKLKNRIKNGVCPCCNMTFKDLARHMLSKHPEFANGETAKENDDD